MEKQKPLSFHNIEMFSKEADELIQDRVTYKAELKDLAAKLLRLIADNENGQTRIKDALVGNASREKLVKSLQTDVFIYRKRLASIGSMKKVADEYDRQETEIRQLKERSENAVKSIETYETDINSFDEIMSAGKVRLETLRSDIAGLEKEKATLTTEISEIKNVSDIFVKKAEMEKEFLLLTEKRDSNLQQIDAVNAKLSENEGVLPGLRSTVESLTKELASLEKKRQESKDYLEQQEALSTELTELGAKKRAIEFSLESLDTTQEELTAKLEGEKAKNEETKIESEILKKQLKEFYNEIGALNREKAKIELTIRENEGVFKGIKSYFQENKYIEAEIETMEELFEKTISILRI
ncbi:hypothetical protein [Candidatus Magnetomonas plexicatena]|uniref:hypothetical protein n=1 Tax=Candidatus Magnetomonas plexicatena TaxID=2552947 RepID=UPI001C77ED4D|nr:hypothetical protein E2O03_011530 [Nitrospirales bacterium LBB_01]